MSRPHIEGEDGKVAQHILTYPPFVPPATLSRQLYVLGHDAMKRMATSNMAGLPASKSHQLGLGGEDGTTSQTTTDD